MEKQWCQNSKSCVINEIHNLIYELYLNVKTFANNNMSDKNITVLFKLLGFNNAILTKKVLFNMDKGQIFVDWRTDIDFINTLLFLRRHELLKTIVGYFLMDSFMMSGKTLIIV